eukprot:1136784-Pelagomonas_calceolata.AAC.1
MTMQVIMGAGPSATQTGLKPDGSDTSGMLSNTSKVPDFGGAVQLIDSCEITLQRQIGSGAYGKQQGYADEAGLLGRMQQVGCFGAVQLVNSREVRLVKQVGTGCQVAVKELASHVCTGIFDGCLLRAGVPGGVAGLPGGCEGADRLSRRLQGHKGMAGHAARGAHARHLQPPQHHE